MHKAGKFELLNLAGGFPAKRTLLVMAISRYRKTTHPRKPALKLPTMELAKLIQSLFSHRQWAVWTTRHTLRQAQGKRKAAKGAKCFRVFRALSRRSCSKPPWTTTLQIARSWLEKRRKV